MLTLHDVIMPAVGELPIISVLVEPTKEDLVRVAVFQMDQFAQPCQKGSVAVRTVLIWQDGNLIANLKRMERMKEQRQRV